MNRESCVGSHHASRITRHAGFTLVELLITMAVFVFVIAAATSLFVPLLTQFKQQSKMAETNIEGVVGLDIMRRDIESAGYGLPWNGLITYSESTANPFSLDDAPTGTPRAIVSKDSATFTSPNNIFDGSDYLVIKAVNVANNSASSKWTTLKNAAPYTRTWTPTLTPPLGDDLATDDRVIVISPGATTSSSQRLLVTSGSTFYKEFSAVSDFAPLDATETRLVYGIKPKGNPASNPRMPFNRADYYISTPTTNFPSRCAAGTGVLYKGTVNHADGKLTELPLLDCVADMQVTYCLDANGDGTPDKNWDDISASGLNLTAQQIREQVKEVRVYIVAHEGQRDATYDFSMGETRTNLSVETEVCGTDSRGSPGSPAVDFPLSTITDYKNYRWKLYTIVVKPIDLGQ